MAEKRTLLLWCRRYKGSSGTRALDEPRYYRRIIPEGEYDCEYSVGYDNVIMIYRNDIFKDVDERFAKIYSNLSRRQKIHVLFEMPEFIIGRYGVDTVNENIRRICLALGRKDDITYVGSKQSGDPVPYTFTINNIDRIDRGALVLPFKLEPPEYSLRGRSEFWDRQKGRLFLFLEVLLFIFSKGTISLVDSKTSKIYSQWRNYRKYAEWKGMFFDPDDTANH